MLSALNKRKRKLTGIGLLAVFVAVLFYVVINREKFAPPAENLVEVCTVKNHLGLIESWQNNFACENSRSIYLSQGHGIYEYGESGNRLVQDLGEYSTHRMVCTDDYLIYKDSKFETYRMDLKTGETVLLFENRASDGISVDYMVANGQDYFITLYTPRDENGIYEKTYLFQGSSLAGVELTQYLEPVEGEDFYYGTYGAYELYGHYNETGSRPAKYISLIRRGDWQICNIDGASCCVNGAYLFFRYTDNSCWCFYENRKREIETLRKLTETSRDECGLFAGLSTVYDNSLYCLVQYSRGMYAGEPNPSNPSCEAVIRISPLDRGESVVYRTTDKYERIVGFDIEAEVVYIYNDKYADVRRVNFRTGEYEIIKDDLPEHTRLYFGWYGDKLFIINGHTDELLGVVS